MRAVPDVPNQHVLPVPTMSIDSPDLAAAKRLLDAAKTIRGSYRPRVGRGVVVRRVRPRCRWPRWRGRR